MFRGRKIGTARRFGKTVLVVLFALVAASFGWQGSGDTRSSGVDSVKGKTGSLVSADPIDNLPSGHRAYSITLDNSNAALSSLSAGKRVDVTAAFPVGPDGLPLAVTVLRGASVIGNKTGPGGTALMLSVSPADAERLAFAVANARIFVSLCPGGPDTSMPTSGVTFDDF